MKMLISVSRQPSPLTLPLLSSAGCEKTFITFSALFSHNRTHFRETGHFTCTYPGCDKTYDKACRLKIHMRSHTGKGGGANQAPLEGRLCVTLTILGQEAVAPI